ncbi:hypothetical protein BH09MYX1_BH09MYX1_26760 [soil metagenome]
MTKTKTAWLAFGCIGFGVAGVSIITCVGDTVTVAPSDSGTDTSIAETSTGDGGGCTSRVANEATGVFVNINGTDSAQCGSAASPCQTVQAGLNQAKVLTKSTVYVARGTYKETITLSPGLAIEGGWDTLSGKWIPACGADLVGAVKLQMPDTANVVVKADFTGAATLRNLSIFSKTTTPAVGESLYGVLAMKCSLAFESVTVNIGPAGVGTDGDAGAPGSTGGIKCGASTGAVGGPGTPGAGGDAGAFGPTGYVAVNGANGLGNGSSGANGTCTAMCSGNEYTVCKSNTLNCSKANVCVSPLSGCGGTPGGGGQGGIGGGSSIAVFGWDATFSLSGGSFVGGNGGNGGKGGTGGGGGTGGNGTAEQEGCASCLSGNSCATVGNTTLATGSMGGLGGAGGAGGGGAGGASFGVYAGGTGKITVVTAPLFQHGTAGTAGSPNGAPGIAADRFPP